MDNHALADVIQDNVVKYILFGNKITLNGITWSGSVGSFLDLPVIDEWCEEHIGKSGLLWFRDVLSTSGKVVYHFDKEENALMFALRWLYVPT